MASSGPPCRETVRAMRGYVPGEQPRNPGLIKLNTNENPYPPAPGVASALADFDVTRLNRYPDPAAAELCDAVAAIAGTGADWVMAGNGSDDILTIITRTFVDQGGCIGCFEPSYSLYPVLADIQGAALTAVPLTAAFEVPDDAAARLRSTDLVFVTRPNAPTGNAFPVARLRQLAAQLPQMIVIDEAYVDFGADDCLPLVHEFANVMVTRSLSKGYSLAGLRVGFAIAQPAVIAEMVKVKDSYNLDQLALRLALAAVRDQTYLKATTERVRQTRQRTAAALQGLGFEVLPSAANFLFVKPPTDAARMLQDLRRAEIIVRYFDHQRTRDYLRVTIGTDAEMDRFLQVAAEILASASNDTPT